MSKPSKGLIFSLSTSFLWAVSIVNLRFLMNSGGNVINITFWINLVAAIFWIPFFVKHIRSYLKLSKKYKILLVLIALTSTFGINLLQSLALKYSPAANFAFLYRTVVVFTIILAWMFFKEKITRSKVILTAFILVGSYLLIMKGQQFILTKGDIYTLLMAVCGAFVANILIKHTVAKMHPDISASVISLLTVLTLFPVIFVSQSLSVPNNIILILFGGFIAFLQIATRNRAYKIVSASYITMIVSLTPVFVTVMSFFLLGEKLEPIQIVGGLMIVSSGVLAEKLKI